MSYHGLVSPRIKNPKIQVNIGARPQTMLIVLTLKYFRQRNPIQIEIAP